MSEKASIKVEWSTFDFDKDAEEKSCSLVNFNQRKGQIGGRVRFFAPGLRVPVLDKEQGARLMEGYEERSPPQYINYFYCYHYSFHGISVFNFHYLSG